jgi:acetyl esterase/lipase
MPEPEHRVEKNVVYGMYSGLALLLDVHHPDEPNGYGVIHVSGSGWTAPLSRDAWQLKDSPHVMLEAWPLVKAGYTVFTVNHRATPRFRYPDPVLDVQRAVRFVRSSAERFGIDPERIGAIGGSSGGHLVSMLALTDGEGDPKASSSIDRLSSKVQCAVVRAVPSDVTADVRGVTSLILLGFSLDPRVGKESKEMRLAVEASPITYVSDDDPPMLLIHGDADEIVPIDNSRSLKAKLEAAGVPTEFVTVPGGGHRPDFPGTDQDLADIYANGVRWMDAHLKGHK